MSDKIDAEMPQEEVRPEETEVIETPEVEEQEQQESQDDAETKAKSAEPPATVPRGVHFQKLNKIKDKFRKAEEKSETLEQQLEMAKRDLELARMQLDTDTGPAKIPNQFDYDSDEEYQAALDSYFDQKTEAKIAETWETKTKEQKKKQQQQQLEQQQQDVINNYAERVGSFGAEDYEQAHDAVQSELNLQAVVEIARVFDEPEKIIYALGNDPDKLSQIGAVFKSGDASKTLLSISQFADGLKSTKPQSTTPMPDEPEAPSVPTSNMQRQLDKMRKECETNPSMVSEVLAFKRKMIAAGVEPK